MSFLQAAGKPNWASDSGQQASDQPPPRITPDELVRRAARPSKQHPPATPSIPAQQRLSATEVLHRLALGAVCGIVIGLGADHLIASRAGSEASSHPAIQFATPPDARWLMPDASPAQPGNQTTPHDRAPREADVPLVRGPVVAGAHSPATTGAALDLCPAHRAGPVIVANARGDGIASARGDEDGFAVHRAGNRAVGFTDTTGGGLAEGWAHVHPPVGGAMGATAPRPTRPSDSKPSTTGWTARATSADTAASSSAMRVVSGQCPRNDLAALGGGTPGSQTSTRRGRRRTRRESFGGAWLDAVAESGRVALRSRLVVILLGLIVGGPWAGTVGATSERAIASRRARQAALNTRDGAVIAKPAEAANARTDISKR